MSSRLESIRGQESSHKSLISTIQELQHRLDRADAMRTYHNEVRSNGDLSLLHALKLGVLKEELDGLRADKKTLQAALASLEEEKKQLILSYNHRIADVSGNLNTERTKHQVPPSACS